jgi:hypothetical protein
MRGNRVFWSLVLGPLLSASDDSESCAAPAAVQGYDETSLIQATLHLNVRHADGSPHPAAAMGTNVHHAALASGEPATIQEESTEPRSSAENKDASHSAAVTKFEQAPVAPVKSAPVQAVVAVKPVAAKPVAAIQTASVVQGQVVSVVEGQVVRGAEASSGTEASPLAASADQKKDEAAATDEMRPELSDEASAGSAIQVEDAEGLQKQSAENQRRLKLRHFTVVFLQILLALIIVPLAIAGALTFLVREGFTRSKGNPAMLADNNLYQHLERQAIPYVDR